MISWGLPHRCAAIASAAVVVIAVGACPVRAGDIIADWSIVKTPPAPELRTVTVDPRTTALLMLDFVNPNCTSRPRCMESMPAMKKLLAAARSKGMVVIHSFVRNTTVANVIPDVAPIDGEQTVTSGPDKFLYTDLEKILKTRGIQTVITVGTAAHGAVLYTASAAVLHGLKVIVPVDGMSSEDLYFEQISAWLLAKGTGNIGANVTMTRSNMITF
jgi:nicotinamidase-related amidase